MPESPASGPSRRPVPRPPAPAPVVNVMNRGGGGSFGGTVGAFITALSALFCIFMVGITAGVLVLVVIGAWIGASSLDQLVLRQTYRDAGARKVAILPVVGVIDGGRAAFVRTCVDQVLADSSIEAVVLRVNSPGGGVTASDQIWYEVGRLKDAGRPVIASFGSVAASGGYYVSCGADAIIAQETSITGSIGVIAQVLTLEGLMDKVGIQPVTLVATRSPEKSVANDTFRAWDAADREQVITMLDAAYDTFHKRVKEGRRPTMSADALDAAADGSVFTAQAALDLGLVDGIGYLDDAVTRAEMAAGISSGRATVTRFTERPRFFGGLPFAQGRSPVAGRSILGDAEGIRSLINDLSSVRLLYLMR